MGKKKKGKSKTTTDSITPQIKSPPSSAEQQISSKQIILALLAIIILGTIIYSNTFNSPFLFDDEFFIVKDHAIRMTELSWNDIRTAALKGSPAHRYLPNISWALNYYFGQLNPFG